MNNVAAYIRISSDKQDVTRQRKSISAWADRAGVTIALWFEDATGKNPRDLPHKREGFQRLLRAVEAGLVDCIVVDSQDRFGTRDAYQWGSFLTTLRDSGCGMIDATGKDLSGDDDASVLAGTLGAITSAREQRVKAERNISAKVPKAQRGEYQGGYPPYGFDVACYGQDDKEKWRSVYVGHFDRWKVYPDGRRERYTGKDNAPAKDPSDILRLAPTVEKPRLKVVREIFRWYATEFISPSRIASRLNQAGVDPVFGQWNKVKIHKILANPVYIGYPTWNKKGGSRFVEYIGGQRREVSKVNGRAKQGRARDESDFVRPDKPLFKAIIDDKTWERVQEKIKEASDEQRTVPKRAPQTDELYLKSFLICGACGAPMRATRGWDSTKKGGRLFPSYYCGTYGTLGRKSEANPSGCFCHRVRHEVLERIVVDYVTTTAPKVADLLKATETGDLELAKPLLEQLALARSYRGGVWLDMVAFVEEKATAQELRKLRKSGADFDELYGLVYERVRPNLEADIGAKEAELDQMLEDFRRLSPKLQERLNKRMESLQAEIEQLKRDASDLRRPWANLQAQVIARQEALDRALQILGESSSGRQKAEALTRIIDKIVCHFCDEGKKSVLDRVEVVAIEGNRLCLIESTKLGPG